jgi:hypothetical protein
MHFLHLIRVIRARSCRLRSMAHERSSTASSQQAGNGLGQQVGADRLERPAQRKDLRRPPSRGDGDLSQDLIRVRDGENAWNGPMNASRVWWHEWLLVNLSVNETKDACVFPSRPRPTSRSNRPDTYQRLPLSTHNLSCETQPVHTFVPLADSCAAT